MWRSVVNQVILTRLSSELIIIPFELWLVRDWINLEVVWQWHRWFLWIPWVSKLVLFYLNFVIILLIRMSVIQLLLCRLPRDRSWLFFVWIAIWVLVISEVIYLVRRRGVTFVLNCTDRWPNDSCKCWGYLGLIIGVRDPDLSDWAFVIEVSLFNPVYLK